jgi:hypothetical protein
MPQMRQSSFGLLCIVLKATSLSFLIQASQTDEVLIREVETTLSRADQIKLVMNATSVDRPANEQIYYLQTKSGAALRDLNRDFHDSLKHAVLLSPEKLIQIKPFATRVFFSMIMYRRGVVIGMIHASGPDVLEFKSTTTDGCIQIPPSHERQPFIFSLQRKLQGPESNWLPMSEVETDKFKRDFRSRRQAKTDVGDQAASGLFATNPLGVTSVRAYGRIKVGADEAAFFRGEGTAYEAERLLRVVRETDWKRDDSIREGGAFQSLRYCFICLSVPTGEVELTCIGGRVLIVKVGMAEAWYSHSGEAVAADAETFEIASVIEKLLLDKRAGWKTLLMPVEDGWFFKGFGKN